MNLGSSLYLADRYDRKFSMLNTFIGRLPNKYVTLDVHVDYSGATYFEITFWDEKMINDYAPFAILLHGDR